MVYWRRHLLYFPVPTGNSVGPRGATRHWGRPHSLLNTFPMFLMFPAPKACPINVQRRFRWSGSNMYPRILHLGRQRLSVLFQLFQINPGSHLSTFFFSCVVLLSSSVLLGVGRRPRQHWERVMGWKMAHSQTYLLGIFAAMCRASNEAPVNAM